MASIKIAGKKFKLASRLTRLYALFIDIAILGAAQSVIVFLVAFAAFLFLPTGPSDVPWSLASGVGLSHLCFRVQCCLVDIRSVFYGWLQKRSRHREETVVTASTSL